MDENTGTRFVCEFVVDRKKFLSWGKENNRRPIKRGFSIFWCIFAIGIFAAAIYCRLYTLFIICIFALYRGLFRWRFLTARQYSLLARQYGSENWTRKISFGDEIITVSDGNTSVLSVQTPCSEVTEIEEKGGSIKLHLKNSAMIRLYTDSFITGTWEECRAHLLRKMRSN